MSKFVIFAFLATAQCVFGQYGHQNAIQLEYRPVLDNLYQRASHQVVYNRPIHHPPIYVQQQYHQNIYAQKQQPLELNIDVPYIRIQTPLVRNPTPYEAQRHLAAAQSVAATLNGRKNIPTLDVVHQQYLNAY
jgi:hypothetical protein